MKKINIVVLTIMFLFLMPFVKAETCDCSGIKIDSVELDNIEGSAQELNEPKIEDNKIDLDVKLYKVNDSIDYKMVIKNTTKGNINIDESMLKKNTDYIEYEYIYEGSNVLKPNEEKEVILRIKYKSKVPRETSEGDKVNLTEKIVLNLNGDGLVANPKTGLVSSTTYLLISILLIGILVVVLLREKKLKEAAATTMVLLILIPLSIHAACSCKIESNVKIEIDLKEAMFDTGKIVNAKMKKLAGDSDPTYNTINTNITAILKSSTSPNIEEMTEDNIVSSSESELPIYMWFDNGTMYWWSEDETPSLNENASAMFMRLYELADISGLKTMDASITKNIAGMFKEMCKIENLDDLSDWDVSKVENMNYTFGTTKQAYDNGYINILNDITGLRKWNVSSVTNMCALFQDAVYLESLNGLENWDTSKVTDMQNIFGGTVEAHLKDITAIRNWNTSNVTTMYWLLENQVDLVDIEPLRNWDVSKVENMTGMFSGSKETGMHIKSLEPISNWDTSSATSMDYLFQEEYDLESLEPLKKWNTSNVTTMKNLCYHCDKLETLEGLEDWDVSKVTIFRNAFSNILGLTDASAINDWNVSDEADFNNMFNNTPVHPEFTKVNGTWSNGTFTKND